MLGRVGILTALSLGLCILNEQYLTEKGFALPALDQLGHSVLGVAVSLLIVFRTQSSNGRFWEARTLWGSLVNNCRSLVRMGTVYAGPADEVARLVSAYVLAIKLNLRDESDFTPLRSFLPGILYDQLKTVRNPPSVVARAMSEWVQNRQKEGRLDPVTAMAMEQVIIELVAAQGGCEKIHITPLPFVYAGLIKQLLLVYLGTLPLVLVAKMSFAAPLVVAVVAFAMLGIEEAGVEIEDPFGRLPNHLPLDQICDNIARDVKQIAEKK